MRKIVEKEVTFCDFCGAENYVEPCLKCGKEACWECKKKPEVGVEYSHAVYFCGGGDGFYCRPCDLALSESQADAKHNAYVAIRSLRDELKGWQVSFEKRQKIAEEQVRTAR